MDPRQRSEIYKMNFAKQISVVNQYLDFVMQMPLQSDIQIIPEYPNGWHAIFAANNYVWTLQCNEGFFGLIDVATCHGVRPNGNLIPISEENGREKAIACQKYFLEWKTDDNRSLVCDVFCDRDDAPCSFCKVAREKLYIIE